MRLKIVELRFHCSVIPIITSNIIIPDKTWLVITLKYPTVVGRQAPSGIKKLAHCDLWPNCFSHLLGPLYQHSQFVLQFSKLWSRYFGIQIRRATTFPWKVFIFQIQETGVSKKGHDFDNCSTGSESWYGEVEFRKLYSTSHRRIWGEGGVQQIIVRKSS